MSSSSATSGIPLEAELAPLRGADIVMAAAGGPPTIDFPDIPALIDAIGPRIVLPMHYKTPKINLNIQPLERFLECLPGDPVERPGSTRSKSAATHCPRNARSSSWSMHAEKDAVPILQFAQRRDHIQPHGPHAGNMPPKSPMASVITSATPMTRGPKRNETVTEAKLLKSLVS